MLNVDWEKVKGLVPSIVQNPLDGQVLMLGYMNEEALEKTLQTEWVHFYSRSRQQLWLKGSTSGNRLRLKTYALDCDSDTLLVKAEPTGPVCHTGAPSCFGLPSGFLNELEEIIHQRFLVAGDESYVQRLKQEGPARIAQKVGEEAVELAIASVQQDREGVIDEAADLLFHFLVNLRSQNLSLNTIVKKLAERHQQREAPAYATH